MILGTWEGYENDAITEEVAYGSIQIGKHKQTRIFGYVTNLGCWDMILGRPWMADQDVHFSHKKDVMMINKSNITIPNLAAGNPPPEDDLPDELPTPGITLDCIQIGATSFNWLRKKKGVQVFATSMKDIEKALKTKP